MISLAGLIVDVGTENSNICLVACCFCERHLKMQTTIASLLLIIISLVVALCPHSAVLLFLTVDIHRLLHWYLLYKRVLHTLLLLLCDYFSLPVCSLFALSPILKLCAAWSILCSLPTSNKDLMHCVAAAQFLIQTTHHTNKILYFLLGLPSPSHEIKCSPSRLGTTWQLNLFSTHFSMSLELCNNGRVFVGPLTVSNHHNNCGGPAGGGLGGGAGRGHASDARRFTERRKKTVRFDGRHDSGIDTSSTFTSSEDSNPGPGSKVHTPQCVRVGMS